MIRVKQPDCKEQKIRCIKKIKQIAREYKAKTGELYDEETMLLKRCEAVYNKCLKKRGDQNA